MIQATSPKRNVRKGFEMATSTLFRWPHRWRQRDDQHLVKQAEPPAAYAAIAGTLALGTVAVEPERAADGHALASCRARAKATSPNAISSTTSNISRRNPAQGSGGRARIGPSIRV
jgi:hypothetical protein